MSSPVSNDGRAHREEELSRLTNPKSSATATALNRTPPGSAESAQLACPDPVPAPVSASATGQKRKIVFPDPVAFRFLEDDPAVSVVERRTELHGYELYLVEQWACSRKSPTLVIATYTGDQRQSLVAGVLAVPVDESTWSPRLRLYFKATQQYHSRPKETTQGELMVTNLNSFPSALTVIPVPDGDIRTHRQSFILNENLKRLGCAGRSALTLSAPSTATQTKFYELYRINDRVHFSEAVLELVKVCQAALFLFGKLDQEYIDGLLCDMTETAIGDWWTELGAEHYNFEPTDGILGPSTVAGLLGMLMGARNRLQHTGVSLTKDVFDIEAMRRSIIYFQKSQKLEKSRRLDRPTLLQLYRVTAKAAAGETWGVQKAVKSTVSEIGGKRGEMVMGMVSGKDKAGIGDIETIDLDRFVGLASGERAKWLWHGKPRKTGFETGDKEQNLGGHFFAKEDTSPQQARRSKPAPLDEEETDNRRLSETYSGDILTAVSTTAAESPAEKDAFRKNVLRNMTSKMNDARSGLGRIKDAVGGGLRGHASRPSVSLSARGEPADGSTPNPSAISALAHQSAIALSNPAMATARAFTWKNKPEEYLASMRGESPAGLVETPEDIYPPHKRPAPLKEAQSGKHVLGERDAEAIGTAIRRGLVLAPPSAAGSVAGDDNDLSGPVLEAERAQGAQYHLHRRHSIQVSTLSARSPLNESRWPRRMSFSEAEEAVLGWDELIRITSGGGGGDNAGDDGGGNGGNINDDKNSDGDDEAYSHAVPLAALAELTRALYSDIQSIHTDVQPMVLRQVAAVAALSTHYSNTHASLEHLQGSMCEAYDRMQHGSAILLADERGRVNAALREVEVQAQRLDYEIDALESKAADVEEGAAVFERQVEEVERRAGELKAELEREGWVHWLVRTVTGIGTGPNITRGEVKRGGG